MAVIYITEADSTQHKFRLPVDPSVVITIGREDDCVIPMPGIIGISGLHCSITLVGNEYVITDEGSSNGTLDGERAISSEPLRAGVVYGIGNAALTFDPELPEAEAEPVLEPEPAAEAELVLEPEPAAEAEPVLEPEPAAESEPAPVLDPAAAQPEVLAVPIEVSEYATPEVAAAADEAPAEAPVKKKRKVAPKSRAPFAVPVLQKKSQAMSAVNYLYVFIVLALSFYAGMTLRHWMVTGSFLPESAPAEASAKK